jgi:hypothetical protein
MNLEFSKSPKILDVLAQNNLHTFSRPHELNIIGIRSSNIVSNKFDDVLHVCYTTDTGIWHQHIYHCTTDPGTYFLNHPMNKAGSALLKQGQYINAYQLGLHRGKYKALVQRKSVTVYRSKNSNIKIDTKTGHTQTGLFGINIHHASGNGTSSDVNRWSAGCQVIANINDFKELIGLAEKHAKLYGNHFTYTLLDYRTKGYTPIAFDNSKQIVPHAQPNENIPTDSKLPFAHALPTKNSTGILLLGLTTLVGLGTGFYYLNTQNKKHNG